MEVEFFGEVGTGLGPTLEFFTMTASEFCREDSDMWVKSHENTTVSIPEGGKELSSYTLKGVYCIAVRRCPECETIRFARCDKHQVLCTLNVSGNPACCFCKSVDAETRCVNGCSGVLATTWCMVSQAEAKYLSQAFPEVRPVVVSVGKLFMFCRLMSWPI